MIRHIREGDDGDSYLLTRNEHDEPLSLLVSPSFAGLLVDAATDTFRRDVPNSGYFMRAHPKMRSGKVVSSVPSNKNPMSTTSVLA
jgi:hypothetical protein